MQAICRWCGIVFEQVPQSGRPKPVVVNRTAHFTHARGTPKKKKPAVGSIQTPPLTWAAIEKRAREFWASRKAKTATVEVSAA